MACGGVAGWLSCQTTIAGIPMWPHRWQYTSSANARAATPLPAEKVDTVGPRLAGQHGAVDLMKARFHEQQGDVREREDAGETDLFRVLQAGANKPHAIALALRRLRDRERFQLCQVPPAHVQRRAS